MFLPDSKELTVRILLGKCRVVQNKVVLAVEFVLMGLFLFQESRNELVRVALNGILQHGGDERRRLEDGESSSSSSSESHDQISTASTLRDTDDIKQVNTFSFESYQCTECIFKIIVDRASLCQLLINK